MRVKVAILLGVFSAAPVANAIDLDAPGALNDLRQQNPSHHARALRLIAAAERQPCNSGEVRRLQVALEARDLQCSLAVKTSDPPQQRVTFVLDGAVYTRTVVMHYVGPPVLLR